MTQSAPHPCLGSQDPRIFKLHVIAALIFAWCVLLSGCATPERSAIAGAGTGAVLGGMLKGTGRGMAQGAAIGAAGGYVLGAYGQSERANGYAQATGGYAPPQPTYYAPPQPVYYAPAPVYTPAPAAPVYHHHRYYPPPRTEVILYGRRSGRFGFVYSPYGGGTLVDVRGFPRGARVVDPYCGRVFLNP
jgi:hypothetical protein